MMVRCCRTYEEVHEGDIGRVIKVRGVFIFRCVWFSLFVGTTTVAILGAIDSLKKSSETILSVAFKRNF